MPFKTEFFDNLMFAQRINSAVKCLNMVSKEERPLPAESHRVGEVGWSLLLLRGQTKRKGKKLSGLEVHLAQERHFTS